MYLVIIQRRHILYHTVEKTSQVHGFLMTDEISSEFILHY